MNALYFVVATFLFAQCLGDTAQEPSLQDLIKDGQAKFDKALDEVKKNIGLSKDPNGAEIVKLVRDQNEKLAQSLTEFGKKIEEQIKSNPQATETLTNIRTKLNEAADKLKKENPEIAQNAQKLGDAMKNTWDSLTKEVEKGYKDSQHRAQVEDFFKNIIDKGTAAAKELQTKVEEALKKN